MSTTSSEALLRVEDLPEGETATGFDRGAVEAAVLEGERSAVNRLYARILADPRHTDIEMLYLEEITQRRYPDWSMALVNLSDRDPMVQMQHPEFDPFSASGAFMVMFVDELIASGRPITHPAD